MEFSLVHTGLAAGAAMASIPVILHLILRQKPKHEMFPALRLIRLRHKTNLRKMQIKHWLLLAARMLVIALMALALARPAIHGASFIPDQQASVAAAFIFDTSLSMEYRDRDRTRLQDAQGAAKQLLKELPDGSEVMVLDSAEPATQFLPDTSLAERRIDSLHLRPRARALNQAIVEACRELAKSDRTRREIYLFTDSTAGSLATDGAAAVQAALEPLKGKLGVYVLNVAVPDPRNAFIAAVTPSAEVVPANSDIVVAVEVHDAGQGEEVTLELELDSQPRGVQQIPLVKGQAVRMEFHLPRLDPGVHQGRAVLRNGGGLAFDDARHFTVEVRAVTRVLVVADDSREAELFASALAPKRLIERQRARYQVDVIPTAKLLDMRLADYAAVCLANVAEPSSQNWKDLEAFVMSGGGLGVFLGGRVKPDSYNAETAQALLPVKLAEPVTPPQAVGLTIPAKHAIVQKLLAWKEDPLAPVVVERYYRVQPIESARRVLDYSDGAIAMAERPFPGTRPGRVLVLTTPVRGRPWNTLPAESAEWVVLTDGIAAYLAGYSGQRLNYEVGEDVVLRPDRGQRFGLYLLSTPDAAQATRRSADPNEGSVVVTSPEAIGNYFVTSGQGEQSLQKGFSVQPSSADNWAESRLEPLAPADLTAVFGEGNYAVAKSIDELREAMGDVRVGRELFPWLMLLIVALFTAEHYLANRFYRQRETAKSDAVAGRVAEFARRERAEPLVATASR